MVRRLQHGRFGLNESAAAAIQSLSFYVLLVLCTLTALRFVNVPLTMFTFLGGAIAIDYTKVSGTANHSNFPVLINIASDADLEDEANGGLVNSNLSFSTSK